MPSTAPASGLAWSSKCCSSGVLVLPPSPVSELAWSPGRLLSPDMGKAARDPQSPAFAVSRNPWSYLVTPLPVGFI